MQKSKGGDEDSVATSFVTSSKRSAARSARKGISGYFGDEDVADKEKKRSSKSRRIEELSQELRAIQSELEKLKGGDNFSSPSPEVSDVLAGSFGDDPQENERR